MFFFFAPESSNQLLIHLTVLQDEWHLWVSKDMYTPSRASYSLSDFILNGFFQTAGAQDDAMGNIMTSLEMRKKNPENHEILWTCNCLKSAYAYPCTFMFIYPIIFSQEIWEQKNLNMTRIYLQVGHTDEPFWSMK